MNRYRELMLALHKAHQEFKTAWNDWHYKKIKPTEKKKAKKTKHLEPEYVTVARDKFWDAMNLLYDTQIAPLAIAFREKPLSAVDDVIEFLSVDITAHRCGYAKERFLTKLKNVELTDSQKSKLRQIVLDLCVSGKFRREIIYWSRLMIKLADQEFINNLEILTAAANPQTQTKANYLVKKILQHRKDLNGNKLA